MEPDIRHIGVGGWIFIIHNRYFYLDRKGISLYQNGHGSLQSWLSRPLLSSLAGYVMVSVWKIDDTITVQLTAVEMYKADRCLPWQWQFFSQTTAMAEMSHGGWHCHTCVLSCLPACQQPNSIAAQGTCWQPNPAGACSAGLWCQQRQATALTLKREVCPHWCGCEFGILEKNERVPSMVVTVSCCCSCGILGAGSSSQGWGGASPAWVCWSPWSESWVFTDCLIENTCWTWAAVSPLVPGKKLLGLS